MPSDTLFAVPAAPKRLTIALTHTPQNLESPYLVELAVSPTKGSGHKTTALTWPEGAVELLGPASQAWVDAFLWAETMKACVDTWRPQLVRARVLAYEQRY